MGTRISAISIRQPHLHWQSIFLVCIFLAGCGGSTPVTSEKSSSKSSQPVDILMGYWTVDKDASREKWGDDKQLALRMSYSLESEFEFRPDNTMTFIKGERSVTGKWKLQSSQDNTIEVEVSSDRDQTGKTVVFTFVIESPDQIIYSSSEAKGELVLLRKK